MPPRRAGCRNPTCRPRRPPPRCRAMPQRRPRCWSVRAPSPLPRWRRIWPRKRAMTICAISTITATRTATAIARRRKTTCRRCRARQSPSR
ncbi:MAG TPA: hypothetical protein DEB47_14820 [Citreicella sp.]|nr:hypothetical protein [Citreicella sp.]